MDRPFGHLRNFVQLKAVSAFVQWSIHFLKIMAALMDMICGYYCKMRVHVQTHTHMKRVVITIKHAGFINQFN